jgi:preprotein translocase subunit SecA
MIGNGIYRPAIKEFNSPRVEHVGERIQSHSDFFVSVDEISSIELISENTPAFVTWRKADEKNFSTYVEIFYTYPRQEEESGIAKQKKFKVQISGDCKTATATSA